MTSNRGELINTLVADQEKDIELTTQDLLEVRRALDDTKEAIGAFRLAFEEFAGQVCQDYEHVMQRLEQRLKRLRGLPNENPRQLPGPPPTGASGPLQTILGGKGKT